MTHSALVALNVFAWTGALMIAIYALLGCDRSYLLYLGVGFLSLSLTLVTPVGLCWISSLLVVIIFVVALLEGIRDTRERLAKYRREEREREEAFSEFQLAIAHKDKLEPRQNEQESARENGEQPALDG